MSGGSILIRQVELDGVPSDLLIEGGRFRSIAPSLDVRADRVIDGRGMAVVPPFYNTHTHAAMTLLRGYADDLELFPWLNEYIWPMEAKFTGDDIYLGTRLAALEMIKSGTVFFNDMYWFQPDAARAVEEMGLRAALGLLFLEAGTDEVRARNRRCNEELLSLRGSGSGRILVTCAPHSIYTVSGPTLEEAAELAVREELPIHIHLAETEREVEECRAAHGGMTPVEWIDKLGLLTPKTILAHAVHLTDADIERIRERGAVIAHMPNSNRKLCSGQFRFHAVSDCAGCRVTLGTDGCASNNSLSMFSEMKAAALGAKTESMLPTAGRDEEIFRAATRNGAEAFGLDAGVIAPGKLADALLIDLAAPFLVGDYHLTSNLVYAADSSCVDTVICDGRILMEHRRVPGEREIVEEARRCCRRLAAQ